ncbi:hypothetical protein [Janthinobacterium sp. 67]|uniref:hypothetical protein n=1 Tax=Janthinobacterium sp. 67 TaxID=2035207 RepID=UPI000C2330F8|nr:hypothetical protein [Janthinobacterium sp. 67]
MEESGKHYFLMWLKFQGNQSSIASLDWRRRRVIFDTIVVILVLLWKVGIVLIQQRRRTGALQFAFAQILHAP